MTRRRQGRVTKQCLYAWRARLTPKSDSVSSPETRVRNVSCGWIVHRRGLRRVTVACATVQSPCGSVSGKQRAQRAGCWPASGCCSLVRRVESGRRGVGLDGVTKYLDRPLGAEVASSSGAGGGTGAGEGLTSDEHFTVDGTLLEAWAARRVLNARTAESAASRRSAAILR